MCLMFCIKKNSNSWLLLYVIIILFHSTRLGKERAVIISDYDTAKEVMSSIHATDRPSMFKLFSLDPNCDGGTQPLAALRFK